MLGLMAVRQRWEEKRDAWELVQAINAPPSGVWSYRLTWKDRPLRAEDLTPAPSTADEARFRLPDGEYVVFRRPVTLLIR